MHPFQVIKEHNLFYFPYKNKLCSFVNSAPEITAIGNQAYCRKRDKNSLMSTYRPNDSSTDAIYIQISDISSGDI
jgi:hypothetical protein